MIRLFAACIVAALAGASAAQAQEPPPREGDVPVVIVTGEAVVRRAPDQAILTAAVETRARNPRDAQQQNAETMNDVRQRVLAAGIAKDAIRTIGYTVHQEVDYVNGRRVPREYLARNGIEIRLDAIERTGDMLDLLVQAGATSVGGVRFELKDRDVVEREALRAAVADARARADAAAQGAGRTIDRVLRIDDTVGDSMPPPRPLVQMMAREAAAEAPTPVEPGMLEIRARVRLTAVMR